MKYLINTLVRNKVIDTIFAMGKIPSIRILTNSQYRHALRQKVREKSYEVIRTRTKKKLQENLADMIELIETIITAEQLSMDAIQAIKLTKRQLKGSFDQKVFLKSVESTKETDQRIVNFSK